MFLLIILLIKPEPLTCWDTGGVEGFTEWSDEGLLLEEAGELGVVCSSVSLLSAATLSHPGFPATVLPSTTVVGLVVVAAAGDWTGSPGAFFICRLIFVISSSSLTCLWVTDTGEFMIYQSSKLRRKIMLLWIVKKQYLEFCQI